MKQMFIAGAKKLFVRLFILAALASFAVNVFHYYESQTSLSHMQYVGTGTVMIGDKQTVLALFRERGTDQVFLPTMNPQKQSYSACMDVRKDGNEIVAADFLGHRIAKTSALSIQPYGLDTVSR